MSLRDTDEFKRGRNGEQIIAEYLRQRGWWVIPSYDYSGEDGNKAPRMTGARGAIVIPDLDAAKDGRRIWVEVKTKEKRVLWRKKNEHRHGIEMRHFWSYQQAQRITGNKAFLVIFEEDTREILCASIDRLKSCGEIGRGGNFREDMIFWPRAVFAVLGSARIAA